MTTSSFSSLLIAQNVSKTLQWANTSLPILRDINFTVRAGETVAIIGVSGAGKSTLLSLLAGLDKPTSGEIFIAGQSLTQLNEAQCANLRRDLIGFIFQSFQLIPTLTALENIVLPLELKGHPEAQQHAQHWLSQVGLTARAQHYPHQLSGGEQQRVAIARAFITEPKLLFADEITGNLDESTAQHITALLFKLNQTQNSTLILVTHDQELAQRCQTQYRLHDKTLHRL